ncbi:MAG: hypothetical protein AABM67_05610 [Acidobacteriota bacterium]
MSESMNRADVTVDLFDVYGERLHDDVELAFHNTNVPTFSETYKVQLRGKPEVIQGVPSFPTGRADVDVRPAKYQERKFSIFVVGPSVGKNEIKGEFFVHPAKANPKLISYADLANKSYAKAIKTLLDNSKPKIDEAAWNALDPVNRATILNLCSKMVRENIDTETPAMTKVLGIDRTWLNQEHRERIYSPVADDLLTALRKLPKNFKSVGGSLHHFPNNWLGLTEKHSSFKTKDKAGNIQFTFAKDAEGKYYCDIDLDDHAGIQHVLDYLDHKLSGEETHPYNIHEILVKFQKKGDPEYRLL